MWEQFSVVVENMCITLDTMVDLTGDVAGPASTSASSMHGRFGGCR